jgi:hypothetical protein
MKEIKELVDRNGQVPFPSKFGDNGNALALVSVTRQALKRGGWPGDDLAEFQRLALSQDYDNVINACLTCFSAEADE